MLADRGIELGLFAMFCGWDEMSKCLAQGGVRQPSRAAGWNVEGDLRQIHLAKSFCPQIGRGENVVYYGG